MHRINPQNYVKFTFVTLLLPCKPVKSSGYSFGMLDALRKTSRQRHTIMKYSTQLRERASRAT